MNDDIELLKLRIDAMTGGFAALQSLLFSVLETHQRPDQLNASFEKFFQSALSSHTSTPYGDAVLEGLHVVGGQIREVLAMLETSKQQPNR